MGTLLHCWRECKWVKPLQKALWRFLKKLKIELPNDSAIPFLSMYLKKTNTVIKKDSRPPRFMTALFTVVKRWKQPKCPSTDEWIKKR